MEVAGPLGTPLGLAQRKTGHSTPEQSGEDSQDHLELEPTVKTLQAGACEWMAHPLRPSSVKHFKAQ